MYLYGIIQGAWGFEVMHIIVAFLLDLILISAFGSGGVVKKKGAEKEE